MLVLAAAGFVSIVVSAGPRWRVAQVGESAFTKAVAGRRRCESTNRLFVQVFRGTLYPAGVILYLLDDLLTVYLVPPHRLHTLEGH